MTTTEKLIESMVQETAPVKTAPHPFMLSAKWLGGMIAFLGATLVYSGLRPDLLLKLQSPLFGAELILLGGIIVATSFSAALLAYPDLYQKPRVVYAPVAIMALFALVMALSWQANTNPTHFSGHSLRCLLFISSVTLLPAAWLFYCMRCMASTHPYMAGSIAVLCAFSIGALSLRLSEQTDSILHVMQWHYLPMMGAALIGLGLGRFVLKW